MTVFTVILFGRTIPIPCGTHITLLVEDLLTQRSFLSNHPFQQVEQSSQLMNQTLYGSLKKNTCCLKVVKLYSEKTFDEIKKQVNVDPFRWASNNCSDQVYRLLNFAFDLQNELTDQLHTCYRWTCCLGWVASLGLLSCCFPAPPCINTPRDIFSLAEWLSYKYGKPSKKCQAMMELNRTQQKEEKKLYNTAAETIPVSGTRDPVESFYRTLNKCGLR